jgi:Divergent InlB B-repeat domain
MPRFSPTASLSSALRQLGSVTCAVLFLAACSSGGNDGGGGTPAAATPITGTFVDSPVNGLHYASPPSNPAGGVTANGGQYHCMTGDTVTFDLGGRTIGAGQPCGPLVTVVSVFGATSTADPRVIHLAQLLLTLGGMPSGQNPVQLPATVPAGLPSSLDFSDPNFTSLLQTSVPGVPIVSQAQALAHLQASFKTLAVTGVTSGTVTSNPPGLICTEGDCSYDFVTGTAVTLAAAGTGFTGWTSGGCTGVGTCSVLLDAIKAVRALYLPVPPPATLTILPNQGTGTGTVSCRANGGPFGSCEASYPNGTKLVLRATADSGSTFTGWTSGTGNAATCNNKTVDCSITLTAHSEVRATFTLNVTLFSVTAKTATAPGNGGGGLVSCSANGGLASPCGSYPVNTAMVLTAQANNVSIFTGWSGGGCSGTGTCTFTLTGNTTVTANFNRPTLTVQVQGTGTVNSNPVGITNCTTSCAKVFDKGTAVTLTAGGAGFTSWSGCTAVDGTPTQCTVTVNANTLVTALFGTPTVSSVPNFKFIGAPGQSLLAIDPRSPASPTPVKVGQSNVVLSSRGARDAAIVTTGSYDAGTTSFTNLVANWIFFPSGGKFYRVSTKLSDGVPGSGSNVPVQVSNATFSKSCGGGVFWDPANLNPIVGFIDAGPDGQCGGSPSDDFFVLMHLFDNVNTPPVKIQLGGGDNVFLDPKAGAVYDLDDGSLLHWLLVSPSNKLQWLGVDLTLHDVANGDNFGPTAFYPSIVARQSDKVFVASATKLYAYTPSTHTLFPTPVVTADSGKTWVADFDRLFREPADGNAIFMVQTDGKVFRVPLTTTPGTTITTPHFTPPAGMIVQLQQVEKTSSKIIMITGTLPFPNDGSGPNPCVATNSCNNGIIAVDKTNPNDIVWIQDAAPANRIYNIIPFGDYVLYGLDTPGASGALAHLRIEDATAPALPPHQGIWTIGLRDNSVNVVSNQQTVLRAVLTQISGLAADEVVMKAVSQPTGLPVTIGTVSDPTGRLEGGPFFNSSSAFSTNAAMIGFAGLSANPTFYQPFFVDTTVPNSLKEITTPGAANWGEPND